MLKTRVVDVSVWVTESRLVTVTRARGRTVRVAGMKEKFWMVIVADAAPELGVADWVGPDEDAVEHAPSSSPRTDRTRTAPVMRRPRRGPRGRPRGRLRGCAGRSPSFDGAVEPWHCSGRQLESVERGSREVAMEGLSVTSPRARRRDGTVPVGRGDRGSAVQAACVVGLKARGPEEFWMPGYSPST